MTPIWFHTGSWKNGWLIEVLSGDYAVIAYDDQPKGEQPKGSLRLRTIRIDDVRIKRTPVPLFSPAAEESKHEYSDQPDVPERAWRSVGKWK